MREFIYYSKTAVTSGKAIGDNLMKAGRMDIVCNVIISAFFISNTVRDDVRLHLIFDGPPNAPRHLIFDSSSGKEMPISKKDVAGLIKKMLYKCDESKKNEVFPGCFIEKKNFEKLIKKLDAEGKNVFLLAKRGKDIREMKILGNEVFVFGDQDGFPSDKRKFLKQIDKVGVGPKTYFASQTFTLLHNEIDRQLK
jgi:tRNA (pseudouridine54-N1)-methyltransferase